MSPRSAVRRTVGYDRYSSKARARPIRRLYGSLNDYLNFFQPMRKVGDRQAATRRPRAPALRRRPYPLSQSLGVPAAYPDRRLGLLPDTKRSTRELRRNIDDALARLSRLADHV